MRYNLKKFLVILTLLAVTATLQADEESKPYWVIARGGLNLRAEPSLKGAKVVTIPEGEQVTFIEQKEKLTVGKISGYWWQVKWQDKTGYAFSGFLSAVKPLAIALDKPLQGQFTSACLSQSPDTPPPSCSGQCGEGTLLLSSDGTYSEIGGISCVSVGPGGTWTIEGNSMVLKFDEVNKCYRTCEEYCAEGIPTDQPISEEDCKKECPVKGKVPKACPAKMTREQYQAKFSKKHQVILQLNKKGEAVVKKVSKGLKDWKVGQNYGRLYEMQ